VPASVLNTFYGLSRQAYVALVGGLVLFGLLLMTLKKRNEQKATQPIRAAWYSQPACGGPASGIAIRCSHYGLARVIQQSLVILALPVVVGGLWLLGKMRVVSDVADARGCNRVDPIILYYV